MWLAVVIAQGPRAGLVVDCTIRRLLTRLGPPTPIPHGYLVKDGGAPGLLAVPTPADKKAVGLDDCQGHPHLHIVHLHGVWPAPFVSE